MSDLIDLDHVAVAVERHRDALPRYAGELGGEWVSGGVGPGFAPAQVRYANGMKVELLRPHAVEQNDFLRRFLDRSGPGPHHLTFKVPDLDGLLARTVAAGYQPINVDRRDPDWQEAFIHPKAVPGVLVQLAQASGADWASPPPDEWPASRAAVPATLMRVGHAVRDIDEGIRLLVGVLDGEIIERSTEGPDHWADLGWPGPGRIRLLAPGGPASPLWEWLSGGQGRLHHLAFACDRPHELTGAVTHPDGSVEIPPENNLGVRLLLV